LHDLVRAFGASVVEQKEEEAARDRVLEFYYQRAVAADARLQWLPGKPEPERFTDRRQALAWLDGERAGLVAAALWAREERYADTAMRLALHLAEYLDWRRYFDDKIAVSRAAQKAACRAGDRLGEASAWINLGIALGEAGEAAEAIDAHTHARDLYRAVGDHRLEAAAWNNLGISLRREGQATKAIDAHTHARDLYRATGDRPREAVAWNNLGITLRYADRVVEAIDAHTHARSLFRDVGDRHGEGMALGNLGVALRKAGETEKAIKAFGEALKIFEDFEDWYGAGKAFHQLAVTYEDTHRPADARAHWLQAADAYTRANAPAEATVARALAEAVE
jgi:tetratricopeptide (TPR) repeat protein